MVDEVDHLQIPADAIEIETRNADTAASLRAKRARVAELYIVGKFDRGWLDQQLAEIDQELERLEARTTIVDIPAIDWERPPAVINDVLRSLWRYVQLDELLRPVSAEWTVPEWRAA